jgi:uncharacterized membrane protein YhaH (DUF805 family)
MDSIKNLLTTTDGRISRKQWWTGTVVLIVAGLVLSILLMTLAGNNFGMMAWGNLIISLLLIYPAYCIGMKRRQDRDNNGTDLKVLLGASVVVSLLQAFGIGLEMTDVGNGVMMPMPSMWFTILGAVLAVFSIYMVIQLGFLRGTAGANSYGPDPHAGFAAA